MSLTLEMLFEELDRFERRIEIELLQDRLGSLEVSLEDVQHYALFSDERYQRNLMHEGPTYQALVLCWHAGQRSPIHDHEGSSCGVRVIEGVATETRFERTEAGHVFATGSRELTPGHCCASADADIHQLSNLQSDGRNLVTLHIYSPPLLVMGMYSLTETIVERFEDPVVAFTDGAGI